MIPWEGAPFAPHPWQGEALPIIIETLQARRQTLVSAVMGSGKSYLMSELARMGTNNLGDRAIVVVAPREKLIIQLEGTFSKRLGEKRVGQFYGRKKQPSRDVVICCAPSLPNLKARLQEQGRKTAMMIVDEAHSSEAKTLKETIPEMAPACVVGFTATPFRSAPKQTVSLFDNVSYRYTMDDAIADGVLVDMAHKRYMGTAVPGNIDEVCLGMILEHGHGPGIVSARNIADAEAYAEFLSAHGVAARAIHSKQKKRTQDVNMMALQEGEIRCLVHVSLLAEGVDLPWLRWLCLRRKVQARVRFLQEVGRVLRVDRNSDKSEGIVMDPYLLLGRHGLDTAEAIGRALEEAAELEAEEDPEVKKRKERECKEEEVIALDLLLEYLDEVRHQMIGCGLIIPKSFKNSGWRLMRASQKQVKTLVDVKGNTRHIPKALRGPIKALTTVPWALTMGQISDLLDVLIGGSRWARGAAIKTGEKPWKLQWDPGMVRVAIPDARLVETITKMKR